jgi:dTDP-4-dehydrorhamnose 3,5-epimerase
VSAEGRLHFVPTPIEGLLLVRRRLAEDGRGWLERLYGSVDMGSNAFDAVAQVNRTHTYDRGTVRGLHFQRPPAAEDKLITCLSGQVFDVAVDVRRGSPTFLEWFGTILRGDSHDGVLIPKGFAHGVQALSDNCELLYVHSAPYDPSAEGGLSPIDPRIAIRWPLPVDGLSDADRDRSMIDESFSGLVL